MTHVVVFDDPKNLKPLDAVTKPWAKTDTEHKELLGQVRMHVWRGSPAAVVYDTDGATPLHVHVGRLSTQRRGAWGRYYNFLVAYTPPEYRRQGLARFALGYMLQLLADKYVPADRIKSLAGSRWGVLLHLGLGHQMWGATDKGELVVDTPADPRLEFPGLVPFHARTLPKWKDISDPADIRPLSENEVLTFFEQRYGYVPTHPRV